MTKVFPIIAYLAPEIPALSATFVYEEIYGLERRGFRLVPYSVHLPDNPAEGQGSLADRVTVLYGGRPLIELLQGLAGWPLLGVRAVLGLRYLMMDMVEFGVFRFGSWKLVYQFLAGVRLARHMQKESCAHLHIHFAHVPTQIGMYASVLSGIPFTVTAHANDIFERGVLLKTKAARARKFFTISEHNVRHLRALGIPAAQLAIVRCGVSLASVASPVGRPVQGGVVHIGSLGRMVEKKGFDVLIEAVGQLKQRGHAVVLHIAGDGPLRDELLALVQTRKVAQEVLFEGSMPHSKVSAWMKGLDIFALACRQDSAGDMDGIPVVLMEAMSQALPVISTRLSGIPELVVHEQTGLLAEPGNATDLAEQLERLITSGLLREQLARRAFDFVKGEFSQELNLDRLQIHFSAPSKDSKRGR
jgi:colanic acid/amylovoran biosynthesis glycosyltransferase